MDKFIFKCYFCGKYHIAQNIEIQKESFCSECGYKLSLLNDDSPALLPLDLQVKFKLNFSSEYRKISIDSINFYYVWNMVYHVFKQRKMYCKKADNEFIICDFIGDFYAESTRFFGIITNRIKEEKLVIESERWFEKFDSETGYRVYTTSMCRDGILDLSQLSSTERGIFLRWFIRSRPHANKEGNLKFII